METQLRNFLGRDDIFLFRSRYHFDDCCALIEASGFQLIDAQDLVFMPFSELENDFYWMLKSQPLLNYLDEVQLEAFEALLRNCWEQNPVRVRSHHGIFIAQKILE